MYIISIQLILTSHSYEPLLHRRIVNYGNQLLGMTASLTGLFCVNQLRNSLLLKNKAKLATMAPAAFLPFLSTLLAQTYIVTSDIRLRNTACPVCLEIRSSSIQLVTGVGLPLLLSFTSTIAAAKTFQTFPIPPYSNYLFKLVRNLSHPLVRGVGSLCIMNISMAILVTYLQFEAIGKVNNVLLVNNIFRS